MEQSLKTVTPMERSMTQESNYHLYTFTQTMHTHTPTRGTSDMTLHNNNPLA